MLWALAAAVLAAAALHRLSRIAKAGAAYKAKALCTGVFGIGLELDPRKAPEVHDEAYKILRLFDATIDRERKRVTASLKGLWPRSAVHREGFGATLESGPLSPMGKPPLVLPGPLTEPWPRGEAAPPPCAPKLAAALERAFDEPFKEKGRRTRAVAVAFGGRLLAERYAPGIGAATPLPGWSMTKAVTSAFVGILVGDGRLSLTAPGPLAEWAGPNDPRAAITLEDLLRMRSGLRFGEKYADPLSDVVQMLYAEPDTGRFAAARPLQHPPGTVWQYASGTTNILSLLVRRAVGEADYAAFPRKALFNPLAMSSAVLEPDAAGTYVGSSYMLATARDWLRFGELYLRRGVWNGRALLPAGWTAFSTTPTPQSPEGRYGAHWWLKLPEELGGKTEAAARVPADAFHALGHEGQCLTIIPSRDVVIVRLGLSITIDAWDHAAFLASVLEALPA